MDDSLIIITSQGMVVQFLNLLFFYVAVFSIGMFLTNLFPMSTLSIKCKRRSKDPSKDCSFTGSILTLLYINTVIKRIPIVGISLISNKNNQTAFVI